MDILNGIKNFLQFINDNWVTICTIIGLAIALYKKIKRFLSLSKKEKIATAKLQVNEIILKLVTDAEFDYQEWSKSGAIKRAQVLDKIFATYPILSSVENKDELMVWLDDIIDKALLVLKDIISKKISEDNDNAVN